MAKLYGNAYRFVSSCPAPTEITRRIKHETTHPKTSSAGTREETITKGIKDDRLRPVRSQQLRQGVERNVSCLLLALNHFVKC